MNISMPLVASREDKGCCEWVEDGDSVGYRCDQFDTDLGECKKVHVGADSKIGTFPGPDVQVPMSVRQVYDVQYYDPRRIFTAENHSQQISKFTNEPTFTWSWLLVLVIVLFIIGVIYFVKSVSSEKLKSVS